MTHLLSLVGRVFGPRPTENIQQWDREKVTKDEILTLFARELQRYSRISEQQELRQR